MTFGRTFLVAFGAGVAGMLAYGFATGTGPMSAGAWIASPAAKRPPAASPAPKAAPTKAASALSANVFVRDQIGLADLQTIKDGGFRTLIDLRPDGEAADQPPASAVGAAAAKAGLGFAYVPTPHGDIPDATVDAFRRTLDGAEKPVLLYCRSGNRAARVWALAEAADPKGADAETIAASVRGAGQKIDDLKPRIATRIALRSVAVAK